MRLLYLFFLIPFLGCTHNPQITIKGTVPDAEGQTLTLKSIIINKSVVFDSVTIGKNGKFRFKHEVSGAGFYHLGFSYNNFISLLLEPGENVNIRFFSKNLAENYSLTGSEGSLLVQELDIHLRNTVSMMDSITTVYKENMDTPGFDSLSIELNDSYTKVLKDQRNYSIGFIIENLTSLASIKALYQKYDPQTYVLNDIKDLQYMKLVADSLLVRYPDSKDVLALKADLEKGLSNYNLSRVKNLVNTAEKSKLDIFLPGPEGDSIRLSSLKGKYVLLSFWASWNRESIAENLDLKPIYNKYKSHGFEIYQVSFDNNKDAWVRAIHFDELPWISVCDTSYPNSKTVQIYNVTKIPSNYFIDKDGSISARDLHGRDLRIKLQQVFGY
jgi:peroxiredoxin